MASEEPATVRELLRGINLDALTIAERRASTESVAAQPPPGTTVEPADAGECRPSGSSPPACPPAACCCTCTAGDLEATRRACRGRPVV